MHYNKVCVPDSGFVLYVVNDLHIGLRGFRQDIFEQLVNKIKKGAKGKTFWIGVGDYLEGRPPGHKFYNTREVEKEIYEQFSYLKETLRPIMDKCIGMGIGNHEETVIKETTLNLIEDFCAENKVKYLGYFGYVDLIRGKEQRTDAEGNVYFREKRFRVLGTHGAGGGANIGAPLNKAGRFSIEHDTDMIISGHHHKMSYAPISVADGRSDGHPGDRIIHIVNSGTMLESYPEGGDGYEEKKWMPRSVLGWVEIHFGKPDEEPHVLIRTMKKKTPSI